MVPQFSPPTPPGANKKRPSFKQRKSIDMRKEEINSIRKNYPYKIPVIVERYYKETQLPELEKEKYLVPPEVTMTQFLTIIRNRMSLSANQTLYMIVNKKTVPSLTLTMAEIYQQEKDEDGFLYLVYASQETFG